MTDLLRHQERTGVMGDLLEMGAYLGKSTILIGFYRRPGERFVVCDLFGQEPSTADNQRTAAYYTENLTREAFEANYSAFHSEPPEIIQAPTSVLGDHVDGDSCRFVHIDACHLYDFVRKDLQTARRVLIDDGVVVFDDIRTAHTPGVAAAVWPEVFSGDLQPICITPHKLYATWGDARPAQDSMLEWLWRQDELDHDSQTVAGRRLIRIEGSRSPPPSPVQRIAADVLPPVVRRAARRARRRPR